MTDPTGSTEQAMLAAREQRKYSWSDPIMALITLEIFLLPLMGLGSGAKETTLHSPDLLLLPAQQNNQIPSICFRMSALQFPHIHTQTTSVAARQLAS